MEISKLDLIAYRYVLGIFFDNTISDAFIAQYVKHKDISHSRKPDGFLVIGEYQASTWQSITQLVDNEMLALRLDVDDIRGWTKKHSDIS